MPIAIDVNMEIHSDRGLVVYTPIFDREEKGPLYANIDISISEKLHMTARELTFPGPGQAASLSNIHFFCASYAASNFMLLHRLR